MKLCVIGLGWVADAMHGPAYLKYRKENPGLELTACCDIDAEKAKAYQNKFGFLRMYTEWDKMLETENPDAVCLLTPPAQITVIAEKILSSGIPLLMEKPPGEAKEDTLRLIEAAKIKGTPHLVAFNRRYCPLIIKMREISASLSGGSGSMQSLQYNMFRIGRTEAEFFITAIHAVDTVRYICDSDYKSLSFKYRSYQELGEGVSDIHIHGTMKDGTVVTLNICPVAGINSESAVMHFHDHSIYVDHIGTALYPDGRLVHVHNNSTVLNINYADIPDAGERFEREGFYCENKLFFDAVLTGKTPPGSLESALQSVEIADCIRSRKDKIVMQL